MTEKRAVDDRVIPSPSPQPCPLGRGRTCERFINIRGILASVPRLEARRQGSPAITCTTASLAHSALPEEPSGSPSPRGRGLG
jgi:hypothetical protein